MPNKDIIAKLFHNIAPKLSERNGGYLRVLKTRVRQGDCSSMAILEFVDYERLGEEKQAKRKSKQENKKEK